MTSSVLYTPPPGLQFRLWGKGSGKVLYSSTRLKPAVFHSPKDQVQDNQWFYLIHGSGARAGKYAIKGKESDRVIFSRRHTEPFVDHIGGDGTYDDNWHIFEPGTGSNAGWFRIVTPAPANVALISRNHLRPYVINHPATEVYEDQYFQFDFEPIDVTALNWDLDSARITTGSGDGHVIGDVVVKNNSHRDQVFSLDLPGDAAGHSGGRGDRIDGFPLDSHFKISSYLPTIKDGRVVVDNNRVTWTLGTPTSIPTSTGDAGRAHSFTVGPNLKMRAVATAAGDSFEIPFTLALKGQRSGTTLTTKGIWRGTVGGFDSVKYEVHEVS